MKKILSLLLCLCLLAGMCVFLTGCGKEKEDTSGLPAASEDFYYNDGANVLSTNTEAIIFYNNQQLQKACGSQIVVATVPTLGGKTSQTYAYQLFNHWGIGDSKKDNGFLILMSFDKGLEDVRVAEGSGAESIIRAGELKTMIDEELADPFLAGDYDTAAINLFRAMFEQVRDYYGLNLAFLDESALIRQGKLDPADRAGLTELPADNGKGRFGGAESGGGRSKDAPKKSGGSGMGWLIVIVIVVIILVVIGSSGSRGAVRSGVRRPIIFFGSPRPRAPRIRIPRAGSFTAGPRRPSGSSFRSSSGSSRSSFGGSRSSFGGSSSRSSGFGGARGGGGRSSGGGAGLRR